MPYGTEEQNGLSRMKHLSKSEPDIAPMGEVRSFFTFFPFILNICFYCPFLAPFAMTLNFFSTLEAFFPENWPVEQKTML